MDIEDIIEDAKEAGFHTTGDWKVQIQPSQYEGISNENILIAINKFAEIRNKRAVASVDVLVEALRDIGSTNWHFSMSRKIANEALATYDKLSEVKS